MSRLIFVLSVVSIACAAAPARAQSAAWTDRGYVTISGDLRVSAMSFTGDAHPIDFLEAATVATTYDVKPEPGIDVGAGVRVWRNLGIGLDVSYVTKAATGSVSAQIPHPLFFNKPRAVTGNATGLGHDETAVHVQAVWMIPATPRWSIALAAGPSWIIVGQDVVHDITVTSVYPFDTATFASAVAAHASAGHLGYNVGTDITYRLRPHAGLGFGVGFSQASVPLTTGSGETVTIDAGGARVAGGLRIAF